MADKLFYETEIKDGLAVVTLNRPPANALDVVFTAQLADLFEALDLDPRVRALVLTGRGSCFSAGVDLKQLHDAAVEEQDRLLWAFNRMILALYGFRRPTVAAVNGHAIAGGMVLLLCCDTRIGPQGVGRYGLTEGRVGVAFPIGGLVPPLYELRPEINRRWMLAADTYEPEEALAAGAFGALVPPERVLDQALVTATEHRELPGSYGAIKHQLRAEGLGRLRKVVRDGDPYLGRWVSEEVPARIEALLSGSG